MKKIVNEVSRADVTFILEGKPLHAHRCILLPRCRGLEEKVKAIGKKSEDRDKNKWGINHNHHLTVEIPNMKYKSFLAFVEYLYTDKIKSLKNN
jgi:hypothetical protein